VLRQAVITCRDYRAVSAQEVAGAVVYCDPPYRGAKRFSGLGAFDHDQFWEVAAAWSEHAEVFVSEYSAPPGWRAVWSAVPEAGLRPTQRDRPAECLWVLDSDKQG
jgi:hypothetical protein